MEWIQPLQDALAPYPKLYVAIIIALLCAGAWLANFITRQILLRTLRKALPGLLRRVDSTHDPRYQLSVVSRLANVVPALVLMAGVAVVPGLPETVVTLVRNLGSAFIVLTVALAIGKALDLALVLYERQPGARDRPIKGFLQLVKIIVFVIAAVLIVAVLIDRSPLVLLSGMGAMMAVLILVFQDTLLSMVAGATVSSNDMIRLGDWIEMPSAHADGDVIDINLHTVKVQNWDKTITAIPMKRFLSESFKNWRGMQESGGRRIKRSLYLDQTSVAFLESEQNARLRRLQLLDDYLENKAHELADWNRTLGEWAERDAINRRRLTNLGTFRAYVDRYLRAHPGVNQEMTIMVRQLQPVSTGLPLEVYCFSVDTRWVVYEGVQSDIFDHLLAVLPEFGLRVFQAPSGHDLRGAMVGASSPDAS